MVRAGSYTTTNRSLRLVSFMQDFINYKTQTQNNNLHEKDF